MRDGGEVTISVLLCAYNPVRDQLLSAVRSIIDQTFSSWEMVLVDDGSDSSCGPVFQEAAALDSRIRLIRREENGGLGTALNDAIALARGTYLARMDADDLSEPARFQRQVDFLEEHGEYMWVGSNAWLINEDGRWGQRNMPAQPHKNDFLRHSPYIHPSVMFRAEVFDRCGGYHSVQRGEDYELFMRLYAMGMRGYNLQENLLSYRENLDNFRRRNAQNSSEETRIRREGFRSLDIRTPLRPFYVIKPIIAACVPVEIRAGIRKRTGNDTYVQRHND